MNSILAQDRPTGVMASSDYLAIGMKRALSEHGLKIPDDISMIGFDNIDISRFTVPSLTTVNQPREQWGHWPFLLSPTGTPSLLRQITVLFSAMILSSGRAFKTEMLRKNHITKEFFSHENSHFRVLIDNLFHGSFCPSW